jgi:alpha-amylase/alpha-mannosidase (GH57 family)
VERYICIHGHFYQPPRENPWLEAVELQDSAYPYHDWNERITAECYAPNGASRILSADGRIRQIVNNYSRISYNFGPTLLGWMAAHSRPAYQAVIDADSESRARFSGHGCALAQAYNHMILPLANQLDRQTQVTWGIRDFEFRFGRKPEGMWLPETAVDLDSLEVLAAAGIRFTVLSPYQASRARALGGRSWRDVRGGKIDPSRPYLLRLRSGRSINLFFYDGPISRAVAFENLLERGENLAHRLAGAFSDHRTWPQLVHIATDGETYGHHRRHADMALAYALHYIESNGLGKLTNYGEYLERHPPTQEVQIVEGSSWSCMHGIERWRSNCGCNSGGHAGWNQEWRSPLRKALDWLRDRLAKRFEARAAELFADPWRAREHYIDVILDRSPESVDRFLAEQARGPLAAADRTIALKLLELERHAMLMYTSCGWFFDELSGIETVQVIQYAARALQLAEELSGDRLEPGFLDRLERAPSNLPEYANGRRIYEKFVRPAVVDLEKVGAHYAISTLFEEYQEKATIYGYTVGRESFRVLQEGQRRLALGIASVSSNITTESEPISFGVLHLGDQNVYGGVRKYGGDGAYEALLHDTEDVFRRGDIPELIRAVDRNFGTGTYTLRYLFRDEQRKIVNRILHAATAEAAALYRSFYAQHGSLIRFVSDLGIPLPARFQMAVDFTLNEDCYAALAASEPDAGRIAEVLEQVSRAGIRLDTVTLEFAFRKTIELAAQRFYASPHDLDRIRDFERVVAIGASLPFEVNLWSAQNLYFETMRVEAAHYLRRAESGDPEAQAWLEAASRLGEKLYIDTDFLAASALV